MFKSVSSRYIAVFMLIISISFLVLTLIITSMITKYSVDAKKEMMLRTAYGVNENINVYSLFSEGAGGLEDLIQSYSPEISSSMKNYAQSIDASLYIVSLNGKVLSSSDNEALGKTMLAQDSVSEIITKETCDVYSDVNDFFDRKCQNYMLPIKVNGQAKGLIVVSSVTTGDTALTSKMIATIISACLWVFLAALLSIYLTSAKVTEPLKNITKAAKNYAKGNFDERVPVTGRDEITELAVTFNDMAQTLANNEKLRDSFIANVSHDLRTPMTTISGFVDGILDGTIPPEKKDYYLEIISVEVKRLSRLVNTLLKTASVDINSSKLNPVVFNVSEKTRQILISFEKKIDEKQLDVEFICDEDVNVLADSDMIHQVLYNLCDNAVKFCPVKGKLTISIGKKEKKAVVSIKNSGDGIPPEEVPLIFDRFYKTDSSRGLDKQGVGLGLHIAKTIITRHGEKISVNSVVGEYSEFVFTLPLPKQ